MTQLRPITQKEWSEYEWHDVTTMSDKDPVFLRGAKREIGDPPDDGLAYQKVLRQNQYEWAPIMTPSEEE